MTYIDALADRIRSLVPESVGIPEDSDSLFALYALLARAKGPDVSTRDVHDAWVIWMQGKGETHESMVPFEELDSETQREDEPFVQAIREAVQE